MFKKFSLLLAGAISGIAFFTSAHAQSGIDNYPNKPLRFLAAFPPGGSADIAARIIAPALAKKLGQPVIVDNRSGAGGVIGADAIAKSAPDGYTLGFGTSGSMVANVTLMPKLPYDPLKSFVPVSKVFYNPLALVVHPGLGVNSMSDFIKLAKSKPKAINFGTPGNGSSMHLAGELLNRMAGIEIVHTPYKGSGPAAVDLLAGHIQAAFLDLATVKSYTDTGRLKVIAVTSEKRSPVAPEIPTIAEGGVPGYALHSWVAVFMPAGTPNDIVKRVNKEIVAVLQSPDVKDALLTAKVEPVSSTPEQLRKTVEVDIKDISELIKSSNISIE
jgi:tripartite-type tricarboxylate transporter receptor subunit TctC